MHEIEEICLQLRDLQKRRRYWMTQKLATINRLAAHLRLQLGWSPDLDKAQSDRIKKLALKLIAKRGEGSEFAELISLTLAMLEPVDAAKKRTEKSMSAYAKQLPVWSQWAEGVRGFGVMSLATIVGEAGDLGNYPTKGHLWKRFGLAPKAGHAYATWKSRGGLMAEDWVEAGYSPQRRSIMWNVGAPLIKLIDADYRDVYLRRKAEERAKAEAQGLTIAPAAKIPRKRAAEFISEGHIHRRAQRYMEKRLLRDLWQAWRRTKTPLPERATAQLSAADPSAAQEPSHAGTAN